MAEYKLLKVLLSRIVIFAFFAILGTVMFHFVENEHFQKIDQEKRDLRANLTKRLKTQFNMTQNQINQLITEFHKAFENTGLGWSIENAHYFVIQLISTIGYGNITPKTTLGRAMCIPYALIGIPLTALFLQTIGKIVSEHQKICIVAFERRILQRSPPIKGLAGKSMTLTLIVVIILFVSGAAHYSNNKGTFIDGLYVWVMTLTTVGFGDLIAADPIESEDQTSIWQPLVTIFGLCVVSTALNNAADCLKHVTFVVSLFGCASALCCEKCAKAKISDTICDKETTEEQL